MSLKSGIQNLACRLESDTLKYLESGVLCTLLRTHKMQVSIFVNVGWFLKVQFRGNVWNKEQNIQSKDRTNTGVD